MKTHYYILPDGKRVENMKEGCTTLGISSEKFRAKVRTSEILSIYTNEAKATKDGNINTNK